jgi:hypothetical protein
LYIILKSKPGRSKTRAVKRANICLIPCVMHGRLARARKMRRNFKEEAKQKQETKIFKGQSKSTIC